MSWNTIIVSEKGILTGERFTSGDITGNITFSNYSDDVNIIPTVSQLDENHRIQEYMGWTPDNSFNWVVSNLDTTHKLVAAFRLTAVDPLNVAAGTFLCLKMWARDIQNTESRKSAYIGCEWSKRVYADNISYTESYPLGNYWPDNEYNFTPSTEFPSRSAETLVLFLKTGFFNVEKNVVGGMAIGWRSGYASCYSSGCAFRAKYSWFKSSSGFGTDADFPEGEDVSPEFGPASEPDGYGQGGVIGTHDKHSDHVGIPTKPQYGFTSAGFLNHYRISSQGLSMLGEALFPEPIGTSASVPEAIDRLTANAWNSKIIDYIIDCRIIPVTAPATNQVNITCGGKVLVHPTSGSAYSAYLVDEDFVDVDCGVINTPLTEGNFIDFSVTRAKIFIPFYGYVDLAPEYWHGAKIGLYYRFNLMDGSFMVWITSAPFNAELESASNMEIIGQYAGNACIHLPINAMSYSQIIGGMITTGAAIVGAAAGGAIGGAVGGKAGAAAIRSAEISMTQSAISGAANIAAGRPQIISNNSYNGSAALMSNRTPYLLIEFGEAQFSRRYIDENGLPAIINRVLGTLSGFTTCVNPVINFACEEQEAEEIRNLLKSGVIL